MTLDDGPVQVRRARVIDAAANKSIVELVIHEGRNRIVRRLLDQVGHPVRQLTRTRFGPVELGTLKSGDDPRADQRRARRAAGPGRSVGAASTVEG